jgi:NAD(P)-dependent dehydrogenase (short-subunit alcohol dehydrogenase family)
MQRLKGRNAIVTGAGQGIGRGIARRFAREGANVLVAEIVEESGRTCADELVREFGVRAVFVPIDVGVRDHVVAAVERTVTEFGSVDILVNNAWGGGTTTRLEHKTDLAFEHGWRVGLMSALWSMQTAFPLMRRAGWGRIVNVCSLNGVNAHMFTVHYNAAKEALRAMSRTAAVEWGRHNIRTNVICPGAATEAYQAFAAANPETAAVMRNDNPMRRMGDPESDIGGAALFLASDDAAYVNGNTLFVGGGSHVNGVSWRPELPE